MDARAGSLWHKTAGASITREALDQWERSNVGAGPMRVDQPGLEWRGLQEHRGTLDIPAGVAPSICPVNIDCVV